MFPSQGVRANLSQICVFWSSFFWILLAACLHDGWWRRCTRRRRRKGKQKQSMTATIGFGIFVSFSFSVVLVQRFCYIYIYIYYMLSIRIIVFFLITHHSSSYTQCPYSIYVWFIFIVSVVHICCSFLLDHLRHLVFHLIFILI